MKRSLLVTEVFPPLTGGSGRWLWELYRRQPQDEVVIAAGQHPRQAEFDLTHNLRICRLPLSFASWGLRSVGVYYRAYRVLCGLIKEHRIEALHCGKCLPEGLLAWALRVRLGLPYLCYIHGEEMKLANSSRELSWLTRQVLRGANLLIANSRNTAHILQAEWGVAAGRVQVLNPGVDTQRFTPAPRNAAARARLGWGDRPVALTVGRLQKRKGHDMMIRALPAVRRVVPDVLYAIVGDGDERGALEAQVNQAGLAGHVQLLGELCDDDLVTCYQQCDLFVLPNRQIGQDIEGFGMVLVEAQACGTPVVAGASGGTAETMHIPDTGMVVACDSPEPLATLLAELLPDRERLERMGVAGRRWVVDHFDWAALSRQAVRLWQTTSSDRSTFAVPTSELLPPKPSRLARQEAPVVSGRAFTERA